MTFEGRKTVFLLNHKLYNLIKRAFNKKFGSKSAQTHDFVVKNIPKVVFMSPFTMKFKDLCKCVCFSVCKGEF